MNKETKQIQPSNKRLPSEKIQGNALVLALLIVAVTSIIAYALIETSSFAVRRTQLISNKGACVEAVHAAESYAMKILDQQGETDKAGIATSLDQDWVLPFEINLSKEISLKGQLTDLHEKFNLNLLARDRKENVHSPAMSFSRLLFAVGIVNGKVLQEAVTHWTGPKSSHQDAYYLERNPPYRAAHELLASPSELNLIQGFTLETVKALQPYVSALPEDARVNLNTVSPLVLAAILDTQVDLLGSLMEERKNYAFTSVAEFADRARSRGINVKDQTGFEEVTTTNSRYFLLTTELVCQKTTMTRYSLIERVESGEAWVYQRTSNL